MAGSPKKRARREAARKLAEAAPPGNLPAPASLPAEQSEGVGHTPPEATPAVADGDPRDASPVPSLPASVSGEILPPALRDADPTNTARKRAMRRKAQEYAEEAMERLAAAMKSEDDRVAVPAAEKILDRAFGKPTPDIEIGEGGLTVTIIKFGE